MEKEILNISCPSCGAPAHFDIIRQLYTCQYCSGTVKIENAKNQKNEFKKARQTKIRQEAKNYELFETSCSGCGAMLVFEENEAISNCQFCGRSLTRKSYTSDKDIPQSIIPFAITKDEAQNRLLEWAKANGTKPEAKIIRNNINSLNGYYLPYQMINGPVEIETHKPMALGKYFAHGYVNDGFVNCSKQFDNSLLDACEPYDTQALEEFDFAYVAGQRVKINDLNEKETAYRIKTEVEENYAVPLRKMWKSHDLSLFPNIDDMIEIPVLLPVYYLKDKNVEACVNGQTGKVSVRAQKESVYITLPWWIKGLTVLLLSLGLTYIAFYYGTKNHNESLYLTGMLSIFYLIVFACMFESPDELWGSIDHYHEIYNSGEKTMHRVNGVLETRPEILKKRLKDPIFFRTIDKKEEPVVYSFRSFKRTAGTMILAVIVIFLPVLLALLINGFNFEQLELGGSAVWFCIAVPVVPIYVIRFGIQWIYDSPWIYIIRKDGSKHRYLKENSLLATIKDILPLFIHPLGLLLIAVFCFMVYLTAFGF